MDFRWKSGVIFGLIVVLVAALVVGVINAPKEWLVAEGDLGDGRIFQVEKVSFGKEHEVGVGSGFVEHFGAWMPMRVREFLEPKVPKAKIEKDDSTLVIWVTALDAITRTNVDCQSVRLELRDAEGNVYGDGQSHWFGADKFWRVGHVFRVFPRDERELKLKVATWRGTNSVEFVLPNPGFTKAADWKGEELPLRKRVGEYEVVFSELTVATNGGEYWKAKSVYWKPEMELWRAGEKLKEGWELEWTAEDAWGNRGQELGVTKPVLKYFASFYPSGTNVEAAVLITNTPVAVVGSGSNEWWNVETMVGTNAVEILGLFPAGVHTFSEGKYLTNPPTKLAPVRGGAKSGWVSSSRRTPMGVKLHHGHYSDVPVIYVRVTNPKSEQRVAMRLQDVEMEEYFLAEPEGQGRGGSILPFLVRGLPEGRKVRAELVLLPPVEAEFLVKTR